MAFGDHAGDEVQIVDLRTRERKIVMRAADVGSVIWLDDCHTLVISAEGQRRGLFRIDAQQLFDWPVRYRARPPTAARS